MNDKPSGAVRRQARPVRPLPPVEDLDRLFILDPETGVLRWREKPNRNIIIGSPAGCPDERGYIIIRVMGHLLKAHRIVWKMVHRKEPPAVLDHRDHNTSNNRPDNLRAATEGRNQANSRAGRSNTSGVKGVSFKKSRRKWRACLRCGGPSMDLGLFASLEAAQAALEWARAWAHGEFACDG